MAKSGSSLLVSIGLAAMLASPAAAQESGSMPEGEPLVVPCVEGVQVGLATGDVIRDVGVAAEVPVPGQGVYAEVLYETGAQDLELERKLDGTLIVSDCGSGEGAGDAAAPLLYYDIFQGGLGEDNAVVTAASACADGAFNLKDYKWTSDMQWRFNAGTLPSELGPAATEDALVAGTQSITTARNSCGLQDDVSATETYLGRTDRRVDFNGVHTDEPTCEPDRQADGVSAVDFGDLGGRNPFALAAACTFDREDAFVDTAFESDIRFNKVDYNWTTAPGSASCSRRYSVQGVMAHERGHTYGLDHVGENDHGNLTMSRYLNGACQNSEFTLGFGDIRGLRQRY